MNNPNKINIGGHIYEFPFFGDYNHELGLSGDLKRGFYFDHENNQTIFFDGYSKHLNNNEYRFMYEGVCPIEQELPLLDSYPYPRGIIKDVVGYHPNTHIESDDMYWYFKKYMLDGLDMAQFGVYIGLTLKRMLDGANKIGKPWRKIYGLDSFFGGFPAETDGIYQNPTWLPGGLDMRERGFQSIEQVINHLNQLLNNTGNIEYIVGYYKDSLTPELASKIGERQLSFVDIDCDLHSSTKEVLDFLFTYRVMSEGCLIRFDDFIGTGWDGGQRLALTQATDKYNFKLVYLAQDLFILDSY